MRMWQLRSRDAFYYITVAANSSNSSSCSPKCEVKVWLSMLSLVPFIDFPRMLRIAWLEVPVFRVELLDTDCKVREKLWIWSQSYLDIKSSWSFRTPKSLEGCQNEPKVEESSKRAFSKFQFFQLFSTTRHPLFFLNRAIWSI